MMKHTSSHSSKRLKGLEIPLAGLMMMVGISQGNASPIPTGGNQTPAAQHIAQSSSRSSAPANNVVANGVYLYGQSQKPEEIGKEYVVFEVRGGRAIGAVYMPRSEFSCFHGTVKEQSLNVTVADPLGVGEVADATPPEKQPSTQVATVGDYRGIDRVSTPFSVQLADYQRIANVGDNDKRILGICKAEYQERAWGR